MLQYDLHNLGFSNCMYSCKVKNDTYMDGRLREHLSAVRGHKMLEWRLIGLIKMKWTRSEPGQRLVNRLTNSNNKLVKFYTTRKADNSYGVGTVAWWLNIG